MFYKVAEAHGARVIVLYTKLLEIDGYRPSFLIHLFSPPFS
jgi:hypothetical protein